MMSLALGRILCGGALALVLMVAPTPVLANNSYTNGGWYGKKDKKYDKYKKNKKDKPNGVAVPELSAAAAGAALALALGGALSAAGKRRKVAA